MNIYLWIFQQVSQKDKDYLKYDHDTIITS